MTHMKALYTRLYKRPRNDKSRTQTIQLKIGIVIKSQQPDQRVDDKRRTRTLTS